MYVVCMYVVCMYVCRFIHVTYVCRFIHATWLQTSSDRFCAAGQVVRDPRWGRGYETAGKDKMILSLISQMATVCGALYAWLTFSLPVHCVLHSAGEDALVNGRFAEQFVHGLQGDGQYLKAVATCKHSLLYDLETNRGSRSSTATEKDLAEYFLVPFEFCIKRANVSSIMCQYGADEGIPSCANGQINNELYRKTFGGDFFMVSDCDSAAGFTKHWANFTASNASQGVQMGIRGGLDVDCGQTYSLIPAAVAEGLLPEAAVRRSAARFLTKQIALGSLEPRSPYASLGPEAVDNAAHRELALEAAEQSLVLLRNGQRPAASSGERNPNITVEGDGAAGLPLSPTAKIAFIGPHCRSTVALLGNYHGVNIQVLNSSIVDVAEQMGLTFTASDGGSDSEGSGASAGVAAAATQARAADVAVLCLGLTVRDEGEGHDRTTLELPDEQLQLAARVVSAQPYTVAVLVGGGALAIEPLVQGPHALVAVLAAFYPGQAGARAVLRTLLGRSNKFGKLPYTMYPSSFVERSIADYDLQSGDGLTYRWYKKEPVFPFGHGLSYTEFAYEWATPPLASARIADLQDKADTACYDCSSLQFAVQVTNKGSVAGDAVVLGFLAPKGAATGRALFDFGRARLAAHATTTLKLRMDPGCKQAISRVDEAGSRWIAAGDYTVAVGDLVAPATHELTVTGTSAVIDPRCQN
jgi:beta-D-xylosidase 4